MEAFFRHANEDEGEDLFLRTDGRFAAGGLADDIYGSVLADEVSQAWDSVRDQLPVGIPRDWSPPGALPIGANGLAVTLTSLRDHLQPLFRLLVLVIEPGEHPGLTSWVARLAEALDPSRVRVIWLAYMDVTLAKQRPDLVQQVTANLDMDGAALAVAKAAGEGTAQGAFRVAFVELGQASAVRDLPTCRERASTARALAAANGWGHLEVVVDGALAGALVTAGEHGAAADAWRHAVRVCEVHLDQPWAGPLRVKARMGLGSVLVAAGRWAEAAEVYAATAPLAADDPLMTFESWRMASYCHSQAGSYRAAWATGVSGLDAAQALDEATRTQGTLPWLGRSLVKVADRLREDRQSVERRMTALAGAGWQAPA